MGIIDAYGIIAKPIGAVCEPDSFLFGFTGLDHGHAYGMTGALEAAGGKIRSVYDPDPAKVEAFRKKYPHALAVESLDEMLDDASISLVACAAIPSQRIESGLKAHQAGKHFFSDKPGFITRADLAVARDSSRTTGLIWAVYYSERIHNEAANFAGGLIRAGAIGRVLAVTGFGPHRMAPESRPPWFFDPSRGGGILTDLASHQVEQFLYFTGLADARIVHSRVCNFTRPQNPGFHDFGELVLSGPGGESGYFRVDWLTPDGLGTWGDGRVHILGTEGFIEIRKYIDIARDPNGDHVYLVNGQGEDHRHVGGTVGFPFFGNLILDCQHGTRTAMDQDYIFRVAELAIEAQDYALEHG
jgi:predicted dehydrogenase